MPDASSLRRKISSAGELRTVVRTMKAAAASKITQYEKAVLGLADYARTIELGLGECLRQRAVDVEPAQKRATHLGAVVFGSDQGLVGQFNESIAEHAVAALARLPGPVRVWAVGDRVQGHLLDAGLSVAGTFAVPGSIKAVTNLVGQILLQVQAVRRPGEDAALYVFHNRPLEGPNYGPIGQRLLPLDDAWRRERVRLSWPTHSLPQIMGTSASMLQALAGEYVFVSLFRAAADSLASEQTSRLAAMQRAEHSIEDMLNDLSTAFHRLRQGQIDEELFDVVSGFEALNAPTSRRSAASY